MLVDWRLRMSSGFLVRSLPFDAPFAGGVYTLPLSVVPFCKVKERGD